MPRESVLAKCEQAKRLPSVNPAKQPPKRTSSPTTSSWTQKMADPGATSGASGSSVSLWDVGLRMGDARRGSEDERRTRSLMSD